MDDPSRRRKSSRGSSTRRSVSLRDSGLAQLRALCDAIGLSSVQTDRAVALFDQVTQPWSARVVGDSPPWPNDICDDGTPFEFSVAFGGDEPLVRFLIESQHSRVTPTSSWLAGRALGERLKEQSGADLSRFDQVCDLFSPMAPFSARFTLWHAAVLGTNNQDLFKAYLNPQVLGRAAAPLLVERALERIGFTHAWRFLAPRVLRSELESEILYFSLDLDQPEIARAKVYLAQSTSASDVERIVAGAANVEPGEPSEWLRRLTGSEGPYRERPILSCFAFRSGVPLPNVTIHVPIRSYAAHDAEALDRIRGLVSQPDASRLERVLSAMSSRQLDAGRGLITYASLCRRGRALYLSVYIAPELYAVAPPRDPTLHTPIRSDSTRRIKVPSRPRVSFADVQRLISRHHALFKTHGLLARLEETTSEEIHALIPRVAFFVFCFHDIFRQLRQRCMDSKLRALLTMRNTVEQDQRDLEARKQLGIGLDWLFGAEHQLTRDATYTIIAEALRTTSDHARLAIGYCLLVTASECFGRMRLTSELHGGGLESLRLAAQEIVNTRQAFDGEDRERLASSEIPEAEVAAVFAAIDATFAAITSLVNEMDERIRDPQHPASRTGA
jgi:DMATS type aromatic prenyltransferase